MQNSCTNVQLLFSVFVNKTVLWLFYDNNILYKNQDFVSVGISCLGKNNISCVYFNLVNLKRFKKPVDELCYTDYVMKTLQRCLR